MKAVFLDRDGVINKYPGDKEYVKSWEEFQFLPGAQNALRKLTDKGFKIFVISNQAGVSKGVYSKDSLDSITENMLKDFKGRGIDISGVYYCTHKDEDNCPCRKPKTGLIDMAVAKLKGEGRKIELLESYFIGDTLKDMEAGKKAGLKTVLVFSGKEKPENEHSWHINPDFTARDLPEAVDIILKK